MPGVTVTSETYGAHDDGPDVIVVHVDGREVGAYCIADDAEAERASMERMVRAIYRAGMREGAERMRERAASRVDTLVQFLRPHVRAPTAVVASLTADDIRALRLDEASESPEDEERERERWTCIGSECLNPHMIHTRDECFTAEMAEAYMREGEEADRG